MSDPTLTAKLTDKIAEVRLQVKRERDTAVRLLREGPMATCINDFEAEIPVCEENNRCLACQHNNRIRAFLETL